MSSELTFNRYGKSRIRLMKLRRDPHELVDLTIDVQLEGAFGAVFTDGDNRVCIATDTMKNTVYALARQDPIAHVESFALRLADHFAAKPAVSRVRISAALRQVFGRAATRRRCPGGDRARLLRGDAAAVRADLRIGAD